MRKAVPATSEKQFQEQVLHLAGLTGWLCYHTHDSRRSQPGFPDLVLVRPPEIVFAELKSESGKLWPEQREWFEALGRCEGVEAHLWRPSSWPEIEGTLCRRRKDGTGADEDRLEGIHEEDLARHHDVEDEHRRWRQT